VNEGKLEIAVTLYGDHQDDPLVGLVPEREGLAGILARYMVYDLEVRSDRFGRLRACCSGITPSPLRFRNYLAYLAPGYQLDVVLSEQLPNLLTREQVEISLSPSRPPIRMLDCCRPHLLIIIGKVHDDLCNAGFKALYRPYIEFFPSFRRHVWLYAYDSVYYDVIRPEE